MSPYAHNTARPSEWEWRQSVAPFQSVRDDFEVADRVLTYGERWCVADLNHRLTSAFSVPFGSPETGRAVPNERPAQDVQSPFHGLNDTATSEQNHER